MNDNTKRTLAKVGKTSGVLALVALMLSTGPASAASVALVNMTDGTAFQNNAASATTSGVTYPTAGVSVPEAGSYQSKTFSLSESPQTVQYDVSALGASSATIEVYNGSGSLIASKTVSATGTGSIDVSTSSATSMYTVISVADDGDSTTGETATVSAFALVAANDAPTAAFSDSDAKQTVEVGTSVTLDASASSDPDSADSLSYKWDLDGDGQFDDATGSSVVVAEQYTGNYTYNVQVSDGNGATDTAQYTVDVTDSTSSGSGTTSSSPTLFGIRLLYWVVGGGLLGVLGWLLMED